MTYRKLTENEIAALEQQGCSADTWSNIEVAEDFDSSRLRSAHFSGTVRLGRFDGALEVSRGVEEPTGIYDSRVHDCTIGNNTRICNTRAVARYDIGERVLIENVGTLAVSGETAFGNGTEIDVLNEAGRRELPICDRLSAQLAYLIVVYRHDTELIGKLKALVAAYAQSRCSTRGEIGNGARIVNASTVRNVALGPCARVEGALLLEEGTVASTAADPATVGEGVIAREFIVLSGSVVDGGAMIAHTFVGQGVRIGRQFSAENSAFFANCEAFHGEACSVFAGPYTVTHHKSTLLIAAMYSFFNAGSGTNQSNHMYKLGPLHQGVMERGAKTGSSSYLLWPGRIGAFTAVIGKHYNNFDTSELPFSYITESGGRSVLTPAMNLFGVGTRRDSAKWPTRDRRKDPDKLDLIGFDFLSPYTIGKVVRGMEVLRNLYEKASKKAEYVSHKGIAIKRLLVRKACKHYELAVKVFIGEQLALRIKGLAKDASLREVRAQLVAPVKGGGDWLDLAGMPAPADEIRRLREAIAGGELGSLEDIHRELRIIHEGYGSAAWSWCAALIEQRLGVAMSDIAPEQLAGLVGDWREAAVRLNNMVLGDAAKEFDPSSMIGYGLDGDEQTTAADFEAVRGSFESNGFVQGLQKHNGEIERLAAELTAFLGGLAESR